MERLYEMVERKGLTHLCTFPTLLKAMKCRFTVYDALLECDIMSLAEKC
jgi:acyl-coenzyme A synthetase/AMP-(fatty) acid ligase